MAALLVPVILFVGMLIPAQAAMNASISRSLGDPFWAAIWNNFVGLLSLLILALLFGQRPSDPVRAIASAPIVSYWGGLFGALLVVSTLFAVPRLGASLMMACLIAGQLSSSLLFDHMGWLGYASRPITAGRVAGMALLGAGVFLIRRF